MLQNATEKEVTTKIGPCCLNRATYNDDSSLYMAIASSQKKRLYHPT